MLLIWIYKRYKYKFTTPIPNTPRRENIMSRLAGEWGGRRLRPSKNTANYLYQRKKSIYLTSTIPVLAICSAWHRPPWSSSCWSVLSVDERVFAFRSPCPPPFHRHHHHHRQLAPRLPPSSQTPRQVLHAWGLTSPASVSVSFAKSTYNSRHKKRHRALAYFHVLAQYH